MIKKVAFRTEFLEAKINVLHVVQPTMRSTLSMYILASKLPTTFAVFPVLSRGYAHAQLLRSLYTLSAFNVAHVRKYTRLSMPAQLQCSHSGVGSLGTRLTYMYTVHVTLFT